ncbi:MAG: hypothetical protein EBS95_07915, partial [Chitinophagia bacterium]|nr:hypothetical protein [Chitinophagia bacterium]
MPAFLFMVQITHAQNCPVISSVTSSTAICSGSSITLEVSATSPDASPLAYAWYKNGTAIPGATASRYEIASFGAADASVYYVKVSNACATPAQSSNINLTLIDRPTILSLTPSPATVCTGTAFTIEVSAQT